MRTIVGDSLVKAPNPTEWPPAVVRRLVERSTAPASAHLALCAECRYAVLFAQQPRARCTCPTSTMRDRIVFAGQPACTWLAARDGDDVTLAWCTPNAKTTPSRLGTSRRPH